MNKAQIEVWKKLNGRFDRQTKVIVGGSTALHVRGLQLRKPQDLDLCVSPQVFHYVERAMEELGAEITLDRPHSSGFNLRRQYKLDGHKYDFFLVGKYFTSFDYIKGIPFVNPEVVWAARGYFAGQGHSKALLQLEDEYMITKKPVVKEVVEQSWLKCLVNRILKPFKSHKEAGEEYPEYED